MSEKILTKRKFTTREITTVGAVFAIVMVLGATGLGFIPVPPVNLTIMHIPVIVGSLIEGPVVGGMLGLLFGAFSMFRAINTPTPVSFIFLNPIVSILPRILIGVTPYLVYKYLKIRHDKVRIGIAAAVGSFTNTLGVMGLMYALYLKQYAQALHISTAAASKTMLMLVLNGFNSAGLSIIVALPIVIAVRKIRGIKNN
ncbi:membrane protein [Clostridium novyi A str. 4540]|uniref:ECF transporter S component n=1 Tax=Clostridium novyi TaxID=1542 RepID=UPI0004DAFCDD|nr:ECF transporter S component [Clostridium novyi]KEH89424.1 membrane protein [Clostridium novyi A str. 4540]